MNELDDAWATTLMSLAALTTAASRFSPSLVTRTSSKPAPRCSPATKASLGSSTRWRNVLTDVYRSCSTPLALQYFPHPSTIAIYIYHCLATCVPALMGTVAHIHLSPILWHRRPIARPCDRVKFRLAAKQGPVCPTQDKLNIIH